MGAKASEINFARNVRRCDYNFMRAKQNDANRQTCCSLARARLDRKGAVPATRR